MGKLFHRNRGNDLDYPAGSTMGTTGTLAPNAVGLTPVGANPLMTNEVRSEKELRKLEKRRQKELHRLEKQ
jgi:hypothetical protein